ncbi:MAG: class I SAM-dependent methyltransferase [Nitrospinota bacterium]|nr:class I SAM-dependent methyltransferase [Nitrospinota bacterium]
MPDLVRRYDTMLGLIKPNEKETSLLDLGCGTGMLYEHILNNPIKNKIHYSGLDLNPKSIECGKNKFPEVEFFCVDILKNPEQVRPFDYIVMNGVFTEKIDLSFESMLAYFKQMIRVVFPKVDQGIAFNVMSKQVEWEKDFLFHLPLDTLADFLTKEISRNFIIRNDYQLFEYTTYVYKDGDG